MSGLEDTVVVVADDTGRESADVVSTFLNAGATVVLFSHVGPTDDKATEFEVSSGDDGLVTVRGDFERMQAVERLRDELLVRFGRIDALVLSMSIQGHVGQRLVEMTFDAYWSALAGHLRRSFAVTRTFYPVVADAPMGGHYVFINEALGEIPQSHAGPRCIAAAAQRMFMRVLLEESGATTESVRIAELCSYTPTNAWSDSTEPGNINSAGAVTVDIVLRAANTHGQIIRI